MATEEQPSAAQAARARALVPCALLSSRETASCVAKDATVTCDLREISDGRWLPDCSKRKANMTVEHFLA